MRRHPAADPATAGWTLGDNVASLWADHDETDGIVTGVRLATTDHDVGIGAPLLAADFTARFLSSPPEQADACLRLIATRINKAY